MTEPREARIERFAANAILNRPYADPDDDAAIVARGYLRLAAGVHLGDEGQDALRALSDAATPGPWIRKWQSLIVHHMGGDGALQSQEDIDFAVAAVNYVRAALAAQENPA